jgi:hypothetical protein
VILVVGKNIVKGYDLIHNAFREWEGFKPDYFIPKYFIPFSPTGTGDYDCFDTRFFDKGECPVVLYCHDDFDDYTKNIAIPEKTHNNFVEWLNDAVDIYLSEK